MQIDKMFTSVIGITNIDANSNIGSIIFYKKIIKKSKILLHDILRFIIYLKLIQ